MVNITHNWWGLGKNNDGQKIAKKSDNKQIKVLAYSKNIEKLNILNNKIFASNLSVLPILAPQDSMFILKFASKNSEQYSFFKAKLKNKNNSSFVKVYNKEFFNLYNDGDHGDEKRNDKLWTAIINSQDLNLVEGKYVLEIFGVKENNFQEIGTKAVIIAKKMNIPVIYVAHDYRALCPQHFMMDVFHGIDSEICYEIDFDKCSRCVGWYNTWLTEQYRNDLQECDVGVAASKRMINIFERNDFLVGNFPKVFDYRNP